MSMSAGCRCALRLLFALSVCPAAVLAQGGPPLMTDDPDVGIRDVTARGDVAQTNHRRDVRLPAVSRVLQTSALHRERSSTPPLARLPFGASRPGSFQ